MRVQHENIIVVAGGQASSRRLATELPAGSTVIAADGGVDRASGLGLRVDLAIGDFDSVTAAGLAAAEAAGARVERHPAAKDATDLELALDAAIALGPSRIVVVGSGGGRLDHLLGSVVLLGHARYAGATVDADLDGMLVHVVHRGRMLQGTPGELVSLVALHGPAVGVTTEGLVYPLADETLEPGTSRGISNVFDGATATVAVRGGVVTVIRPGSDGP
jgi:thiamine pyrophosphokinase